VKLPAVAKDNEKSHTGDSPSAQDFANLVGHRYTGRIAKYLSVANRAVGVIREDWCMDVLREQGFELGEEMARSEYEPSKLFDSLREYDGESTFNFHDSSAWQALQRAVAKVESIFKPLFGTLDPLPVDEDLWSAIRKETSAGLPTLLPKKMVFGLELERAKRLLVREREQAAGVPDKQLSVNEGPEPCVAYYRTQASIHEDGSTKKKVRMVWGYPLSMILLEACYARPVIDAVLKAVTPISLGYRKSELGALMYSTAWWPVAGTFDWSKWDARCPSRLILEGFRIMKRFFKSLDEGHWNLIVRYFCTSPILMPDGFVYKRRRKGIPSGSFFTSIIGSICNMLAIHFLAYTQELDVVGIHVLGDDSLVGFSGKIDVGRIVSDAKRYFGMKLNLDKLAYGGPTTNPRYLGHNWFRGRIRRPVVETAQRLVYKERYNRTWWKDRWNTLISLYGDNVDFWPIFRKIAYKKGLAIPFAMPDQFLLKMFNDLGGFTLTESPEEVGLPKRTGISTLK